MFETRAKLESWMPGIETSVQVRPPFRVILTRPLLVPTQITPRSTVEAEIVSIAPARGRGGAFGVRGGILSGSSSGIATPFG